MIFFQNHITSVTYPVLLQVYRLLDEMIIAGEVLETSKKEIHTYLKYLESVEGSEKTGLFSK